MVAKLDRFGRSLKELILSIEELDSLGVTFHSIGEAIDFGSSVGRLHLHLMAALAQWERERIRERTLMGLQRARAQGKRLGRPPSGVPHDKLAAIQGVPVREAARRLGVARSTLQRWNAMARKNVPA